MVVTKDTVVLPTKSESNEGNHNESHTNAKSTQPEASAKKQSNSEIQGEEVTTRSKSSNDKKEKMQNTDENETQRIIFLDEPTTGLDPITKRAVWKTIEQSKRNKIIFLTTHSMEEADALSEYIGIMAAGQMRCIGTRERLKERFGSGYRLEIIVSIKDIEEITERLFMVAPNIRYDKKESMPFDTSSARVFYVIPPENPIAYLYKECQVMRQEKSIEEFGLEFTSLEEVFLTVAEMVEPPDEAEAEILNL